MTGVLRRVLHGLISKGRFGQSSNLPRFTQDNLLFICNHNYERYRFAHFKPATDDTGASPMVSFGWGPDDLDAVRTICEYNLRALEWPETQPANESEWLKTWSPAFDVEKVTKRFYLEYAEVFKLVEDALIEQGSLVGEELRLFTQSLFNRLMFLRFIERKGWLKLPDQLGTRYLSKIADVGGVGKRSIYASRIRPLFFDGLAKEGEQESAAYGTVPLLNGGLFEKSELDIKVTDIPDEVLLPIIASSGLFYRYNFTVEESTPLDIEVAVDPEMLGKVFEELVTGRHESGSYYTPRPVVAFMCCEALKGHLTDRTDVPEESIAHLVDDHIIKNLTEAHAKAIIDALDDLNAVDPACGSGAYLLGLLQELIAIRRVLQNERLIADPSFLYNLKLHIISNNLYGVDIDPFATEIAKLRLWLSLAVEADQPVPLPNLDFKIETGDSLLGPNPQEIPGLFLDKIQAQADKIAVLKNSFIFEFGPEKYPQRDAILNEEATIAEALEVSQDKAVIDWRIQFAEVFFRNGGFDIVLANPPYVRQELITSIKPILKKHYPGVYAGAADLYVYFYARGIQLLRDGGHLSYIAPNKFFRAKYGEKLRAYLTKRSRISVLIDFADYPIFQAITYPAVLITQKTKSIPTNSTLKAYNWDQTLKLNRLGSIIHERSRCLSQSDLGTDAWRIISERVASVMSALSTNGKPLDEVVKQALFYGIKTGCNEVFEIDTAKFDSLVDSDPNNMNVIRPWLRGRNVGRWGVKWDDKYLVFTRRGIKINEYPAIKKYLSKFRQRLEPRPRETPAKGWPGRKPGTYKWYEIQDAIDYWKEFDKPKIIYQVIATYQQFAYTDQPYVSNDKTWIIPDPPAGLLAYLNSKVAWFFLDQVAPKLQGGAFELRSPAMSQLPVPKLSKKLANLEKKAISFVASTSDRGSLADVEAAIDREVVHLFKLTEEQEAVVDEVVKATGNRFPKRFRESDEYQKYVSEMFGDE